MTSDHLSVEKRVHFKHSVFSIHYNWINEPSYHEEKAKEKTKTWKTGWTCIFEWIARIEMMFSLISEKLLTSNQFTHLSRSALHCIKTIFSQLYVKGCQIDRPSINKKKMKQNKKRTSISNHIHKNMNNSILYSNVVCNQPKNIFDELGKSASFILVKSWPNKRFANENGPKKK